jgi:hypothetical protein
MLSRIKNISEGFNQAVLQNWVERDNRFCDPKGAFLPKGE